MLDIATLLKHGTFFNQFERAMHEGIKFSALPVSTRRSPLALIFRVILHKQINEADENAQGNEALIFVLFFQTICPFFHIKEKKNISFFAWHDTREYILPPPKTQVRLVKATISRESKESRGCEWDINGKKILPSLQSPIFVE